MVSVAPLAGRVKTRLAPRLGAAAAARLHARLMRVAVHMALEARCGPVELHVTARHRLFRTLNAQIRLQRGRAWEGDAGTVERFELAVRIAG